MFKPIRLLNAVPRLDYFRFHKAFFLLSLALCVGTVGSLLVRGLNLGVDFAGGILIEVRSQGPADLAKMRLAVGSLDLGDVALQEFGGPTETLIRVQRQDAGPTCYALAGQQLDAKFGAGHRITGRGNADGTRLDIIVPAAAANAQPRDVAATLGLLERQVQAGSGTQMVADLPGTIAAEWCQQVAIGAVKRALGAGYDYRRTEVVGPKVGDELMRDGILAVILALFGIMGYMAARFGWRASVSGVVALLHDCLTTIGLFSVTGMQFDLTIVAAVVTIAGFSINDTVVIDDRIRENTRKYKRMDFRDLINRSVNETMSRTIMTNGLVLLTAIALVWFGGPVLRGFAIALLWGVIIGTYSTIYVAAPMEWYLAGRRNLAAEKEAREAATAERP